MVTIATIDAGFLQVMLVTVSRCRLFSRILTVFLCFHHLCRLAFSYLHCRY